MIVLNERKYAERVIANGDMGKSPMFAAWRVVKYYYALGYKKADVKRCVMGLLQNTSLLYDWKAEKYEPMVDKILDRAKKVPLVEIDSLTVTMTEMEKIDMFRDISVRKLAFTLLLLAKYHTLIKPESDHWVNESDSELFNLANVKTSRKRHGVLLHMLYQNGLIDFSEATNSNSIHVLFVDDAAVPAVSITDMRNIGNQFCQYVGAGRFAPCQICGKIVQVKGIKLKQVRCEEHKVADERNQVVECKDCHKIFVRERGQRTDVCPRCNTYRRNLLRKTRTFQPVFGIS